MAMSDPDMSSNESGLGPPQFSEPYVWLESGPGARIKKLYLNVSMNIYHEVNCCLLAIYVPDQEKCLGLSALGEQ